ncbi:MAG: G8 domain-containing protein [Pirellulales bacterium]
MAFPPFLRRYGADANQRPVYRGPGGRAGRRLRVEALEVRHLLATTTAIGVGGAWDDPATWDNGVPSAAIDVVVPQGTAVQLVGSAQEAKTLLVQGSVEVVENSVHDKTLSTDWILVDGGVFRVGSESDPYDTNTFTLTLEGDTPTQSLPDLGIAGNDAFVIVRSGGTLELVGKTKQSWTQLGATATAGSNTVTLKSAVNWEVGDEIVIASTTFDMNEAEPRRIVAISADHATFTLDAPLAYTHFGQLQEYDDGKGTTYVLDERAEVGLLTRNIKVQGDADSAVDGIGGNLMFLASAGPIHIDGAELYHMGQKGRLGRYPIHWHLAGNRDGDVVENTSIHRTFNRALTIHGTHKVLVSQTVAYDHIGHGYFLEDAVETGNRLYYNLGLVTREPQPGEELLPSDLGPKQFQISGPGTFWITNPNNELIGNVAAGSQDGSGFWYALPSGALGASASDPKYRFLNPRSENLGVFLNNRAHSNAVGLDVDGGPNRVTEEPESSHYSPPSLADFNHLTAFANSKNGVYFRGTSNIHLTNARLADNVQATMFAFDQTISDSLIVGVSDNDFGGETKHGIAVYDGPNVISNVHFAGFNDPGAGTFTVIGAAERHVNHRFSGITFDDPATPFTFPDTPANNTIARHWGFSLYDVDGSLTGRAGQSIVYDHPMMRSDGDVVLPGWEKAVVSGRRFGHLRLQYGFDSVDQMPTVTVSRSGGPGADASFTEPPLYERFTQLGALMNTNFVYTVHYDTALASNQVEIKVEEVSAGDFLYVRIENPWEWTTVPETLPLKSEQLVRDSDVSAYYVEADGDVFVKLVVEENMSYESVRVARTTPPRQLRVDTTVDESDGDTGPGDLSLREAIELANARLGFDEITFAPSLSGNVILLTLGALAVTDTTRIDASALPAGLTIDASGNDPTPELDNGDGTTVLNINDGRTAPQVVELRGLALTGGDSASSGGAINSYESLTLVDSVVWGNSAAAHGGGIYARIYTGGKLQIDNSTVSGNRAGANGGGIWMQAVVGATAAIRNSTVAHNTADADSSGDAGGGLWVGSLYVPTLVNTIVAGNVLGDGLRDDVLGGVAVGSAFNLIGVGNVAVGIADSVDGNRVGTLAAPIDARLAPLADNGGARLSHALLPLSPALNAGDPLVTAGVGGVPLSDGRGAPFGRVRAAIDIGAFEATPIAADGNGDGIVDGLDFLVWAAHFGDHPAEDPPGARPTATMSRTAKSTASTTSLGSSDSVPASRLHRRSRRF